MNVFAYVGGLQRPYGNHWLKFMITVNCAIGGGIFLVTIIILYVIRFSTIDCAPK